MLFLLLLLSLFVRTPNATHTALRTEIKRIAAESKGVVGVAVKDLESGDTLTFNGTRHFVMHSVFKLPIAITYLHLVDHHRFSLTERIHFTRDDMYETYSPLRDKYPNGNVDIPAMDVLKSMVSQSDNCACDRVLRLIGGPSVVDRYMHVLGHIGMQIRVTERQMAAKWRAQYQNWCTPITMMDILERVQAGGALSEATNAFLLQMLRETTTGPARIKALLPEGTSVAHKTGTSPTNARHLSPATNDVGILTLPNGHHLAIAVFVGDSKAAMQVRERVISNIAKAIWDEYTKGE